jgi:hypothetical protein
MARGSREIRAGRAYVELGVRDKLRAGLLAAQRKLQAFGSSVRRYGTVMTAAGGAILAPIAAASKLYANVGDQLEKLAARSGIGVNALSELGFAAEQSGSSLDELGGAVLRMNRRLGRITAGLGSGQQVKALEALGFDAATLEGMDAEERLLAIADAMAAMSDKAEAAGLAQRAFGTQIDAILPLLLQGRDGIAELRKQAREFGLTVSTESAVGAAKLTDAMNIMGKAWRMVTYRVGEAVAGPLAAASEAFGRIAATVGRFVEANQEVVRVVALAGGGLTAAGVTLLGVASAAGVASVAMGGLATMTTAATGALAAIASPVGVATAALAVGAAAWLRYTETGRAAMRWLVSGFNAAVAGVRRAIGAIGSALAAGDIGLAADVLWKGIKLAFLTGTQGIRAVWSETFYALQRVATEGFFAVRRAWVEVSTWFWQNFPELTAMMSRGWSNALAGMGSAAATFRQTVTNVWHKLFALFDEGYDAQAAIAVGQKELADTLAKIEQDRVKAVVAANNKARKSDAEHAEDRRKALADLREKERAALDALGQGHADRIKAAAEELRRAREAYNKAVAAGESSGSDLPDLPRSGRGPVLPDMEPVRQAIEMRLSSVGTFNPSGAALALGGGSSYRELVKNTARTVAELRALREEGSRNAEARFT